MRIHAAVQPSVSNTTTARRMAGSRFSVSNDNTAWKSAAAQAAAGINGIDVLLALHGVGGGDRAPPPFRQARRQGPRCWMP